MYSSKKGGVWRGEEKTYSDKSHMSKSFSGTGQEDIWLNSAACSFTSFPPLFIAQRMICTFYSGADKSHFPLIVLLLEKFKWSISTPMLYNSDLLSQFSYLTFIQRSTARICLQIYPWDTSDPSTIFSSPPDPNTNSPFEDAIFSFSKIVILFKG